ncbi:MAG: type III secretion system export apparatus subunit SctT [Burkholderiales bacterium]|nr:type III secretion system export apparatus subunit SctT [Burkholderiales bacterium]
MNWSDLNIDELLSHSNLISLFLLCIARPFGLMVICPLFEKSYITAYLKILLAMLFSIFILPSQLNQLSNNINLFMFCALLIKEFLLGAVLSYIVSFPFWLVENCGNIIDIQRGEQFGAQMNPMAKTPTSSIAKLMTRAFAAYFVARDGLVFIFDIMFQSFNIVKLGSFKFSSPIINSDFYIKLFSTYFSSILILAMPVVIAMMCLEITLALISSFVPQLNVTILSMPIKSIIALLVLTFYLDNLFYKVVLDFVTTTKAIF